MTSELKELYKEIAALTKAKCGQCRVPYGCCDAWHCEMTAKYAEEQGVKLQRTNHPKFPFLDGDGNCIVPPHLRPICAVHVCENHLWKDLAFHDRYFKLRDRICQLECQVANYPELCADCNGFTAEENDD